VQRVWNAVLALGGFLESFLWQSWHGVTALSSGCILWRQVVHSVMLRLACIWCKKVTTPIFVSNCMRFLSSGMVFSPAAVPVMRTVVKIAIKIVLFGEAILKSFLTLLIRVLC